MKFSKNIKSYFTILVVYKEDLLKIIKRIKTGEDLKFKVHEVYDISQTNATRRKEKTYSKE